MRYLPVMFMMFIIVLGAFINAEAAIAGFPVIAYGGALIASIGVGWMFIALYRKFKR